MDRLKKLVNEVLAVLGRMTPMQKATMAAFAAMVVAALVAVVWLGSRPEYVKLVGNLDQAQLDQVARALDERGEKYVIEGGVVRVKSGRRAQLAGALIEEKIVPAQKVIDYQTYLDTGSVFQSRDTRKTLERLAQATEIERMITTIEKVAAATVVLSPEGEPSFLSDEATMGASISVSMRAPNELDRTTVNTIMGIVRGAVVRVDPEKITVVDTRTGRSYSKRDQDDVEVAGSTLFRLKRDVEEELADKVRRIFTQMNVDCTVEVNAELDLDKVREKAQQIDPDKSFFDIEREKTIEPGPGVAAGPVGTSVNVAGGPGMGGVETSAGGSRHELHRTQPAVTYLVRDIVRAPKGVAVVTASVVLFDRTIEKGGRRAYDSEYYEKHKPDLKKQIQFAIGAKDEAAVALMYMPSPKEAPAAEEAPTGAGLLVGYVRRYSVLVVLAAVVLSLGLLWSIARRELTGALGPAAPEDIRRRRRVPVIPPPSAEIARLRDMQAQVREVVHADPRAAAQLVKQWLARED